jgi:hypothetical protein|tara:strand:- start:3488 stop:3688 length:201 start_codon:yes stop_codon:yes gene_type:complete
MSLLDSGKGWGRKAWSSGAFGFNHLAGTVTADVKYAKLKKLRRQQIRERDDEEVLALMMLTIIRGS